MFTGIIILKSNFFFLKYIFNYFYVILLLKIYYLNFLEINIGDSLIINGICLTLIWKNFNFCEFEVCFKTLNNIINLENFYFLNIEKSIKVFNYLNGNLIFGHINNKCLILKINLLNNLYKFCILINYLFKNFILYKSFILINGICLTINKINFILNNFLFCVNILFISYFLGNFLFNKLFDNLNIEVDLFIYYIIIFIYFF